MLYRYFLIYKPFGMLSQFSGAGDRPTLAGLNYEFTRDVYPVGRLDADSEGLLILTNDPTLNQRILNPKYGHQRTYLAQVEGEATPEAIMALENGLTIVIQGASYTTLPARAELLTREPELPVRIPPIRFRKSVPTSWIKLTLTEGKNRQVRRMTAATGFPTLRLVRISIGSLSLEKMLPGDVTEIKKSQLLSRLYG